MQLKDYEQLYVCRKCHQEGLSRQEAGGLNDADSNLSRTASNSSSTIPLSDVATPPMSPVPKKRKRGRRPSYTQMTVTPALTRSRSRALRQLGD